MTIRELFDKAEGGTLTYEQFETLAKEAKANFKDLSGGDYVSVNKYNADVQARAGEVETLNGTIAQRDADLADLKARLEAAGTDAEKLATLSKDFDGLKAKYDDDVKAYKAQLRKQAYEFAVREFANSKQFTSNAAKRDFIQSMIGKELKMDGQTILGADDFVKAYSVDNGDAFKAEEPQPAESQQAEARPRFVDATPGEPVRETGKGFGFSFMPQTAN